MPVRRVRPRPQPLSRALAVRQALESLVAVAAVAALVGVLLLLFGKPAPPQAERTVHRAAGGSAAAATPGTPPGRETAVVSIPVTTVYYPVGQEAVARHLAARYPAVRRVLPRPASLPGSGRTVVVTSEFRA